jgi:tetratricopeptide (TPR) repeat protein
MHFRFFLLVGILSTEVGAQDSVVAVNPVAQAVALRDSGKFETAAILLREVLNREPDNGDAARLLAQTLYWMKDVKSATEIYEAAIARHPADTAVRLDYAQMLVETRSDLRAMEILRPFLDTPATAPRARALALAGTTLYWQGDLTGAASRFRSALDADPSNADASRQLGEIRAISAPWTAIRSNGLTDDQPLDHVRAEIEAGGFINPLLSTFLRVRPMSFKSSDSTSANIIAAEAGISHYAPAAHLETRFTAGMVHRTDDDDWIASGSLRLRLPRHFSIEGRAERAPYLHTIASLEQPIMPWAGRIAVALNHPAGWLGEAALRIETFPDENTVTSSYVWGLAPIVRAAAVTASIGYSFAMQDSKDTRLTLLTNLPPVLDPAVTYLLISRYEPYYTPEGIISHSALASIALRPSSRTTVTARGGYGFSAREDAPQFRVVNSNPATVVFEFVERDFNPWDAHLGLVTLLSENVTLSATVERFKTAFYTATSAGLSVSYRFLPAIAP